jgi:hypothetical protein
MHTFKKLIPAFVFICMLSVTAFAQQVSINFAGGQLSNGEISLTFTSGEAVSGAFSSDDLSLSSGFSLISSGLITSDEVVNSDIPATFGISQNYPNPFNPSTNIEYMLPKSADLRIEVYNSIGMRVAVLVDQQQSAGFHTVRFNASSYSSGMYFYRLVADGNVIETKKMLLIK